MERRDRDRKVTIGEATLNRLKIDSKGRIYREIRCIHCRSWLGDEYVFSGRLMLKCFRCGTVMTLEFKHAKGVEQNGRLTS